MSRKKTSQKPLGFSCSYDKFESEVPGPDLLRGGVEHEVPQVVVAQLGVGAGGLHAGQVAGAGRLRGLALLDSTGVNTVYWTVQG